MPALGRRPASKGPHSPQAAAPALPVPENGDRARATLETIRRPGPAPTVRPRPQATQMARKSFTLVWVGPVITRSPSGAKKP